MLGVGFGLVNLFKTTIIYFNFKRLGNGNQECYYALQLQTYYDIDKINAAPYSANDGADLINSNTAGDCNQMWLLELYIAPGTKLIVF